MKSRLYPASLAAAVLLALFPLALLAQESPTVITCEGEGQMTSTDTETTITFRDKVVVTGHYTMTQKKTGKPVDSDWAHIFTFKGGKLAAWRELNDSAAFYKAYR